MAEFTDEELMAFADGELEPARADALRVVLPTRPDLARRVDAFATSRRVVSEAAAEIATPVPAALRARVEEMIARAGTAPAETGIVPVDNVVPFAERRVAPSRPWRLTWMTALAASVAAVLAGLAGYWTGVSGTTTAPQGIVMAGALKGGVADGLSRLASGERQRLDDGADLALVASFRDGGGVLCREYEMIAADSGKYLAVACWRDGGWTTELALHTARGDDQYVPASGTAAVDAFLGAVGAEAALQPDEESKALQAVAAGRP